MTTFCVSVASLRYRVSTLCVCVSPLCYRVPTLCVCVSLYRYTTTPPIYFEPLPTTTVTLPLQYIFTRYATISITECDFFNADFHSIIHHFKALTIYSHAIAHE